MIEIYFTKPKGFNLFSWLLRKVQKVPYSHVAIRCGSWVYESKWPVSKRSKVEDFKRHNEIVLSKPIIYDRNDGMKVRKFLDGLLGRWYSPMQIGSIFADMFGYAFLKEEADNNYAKLICTEYVYAFYKEFMSGEYPEDSDSVDLIEIYTVVFLDKRVWKGVKNDFSNFIR